MGHDRVSDTALFIAVPGTTLQDVKYFALDPGDTTGYAGYSSDLQLIRAGQATVPVFFELLKGLAPKTFIVEDFVLYDGKAQQQVGSKFVACQIIGAVRYHAELCGSRIEMQGANVKSMGFRYSGLKPATDHAKSHVMDAMAHASYFFTERNVRPDLVGWPHRGQVAFVESDTPAPC